MKTEQYTFPSLEEKKAWEAMYDMYIGFLRGTLPKEILIKLDAVGKKHVNDGFTFLESCRKEMHITSKEQENMIAECFKKNINYGAYELENVSFICKIKLDTIETSLKHMK